MSRFCWLTVAIALLTSWTQLHAADPPETITNEMFRSVRIVRDLAKFDVLGLRSQPKGAWIVAEIRPHEQSGTLRYEQGSSLIQVGGQWKRIELLSGEAPPEGRFQWSEPYVNHSFDRTFSIYDYYSVFTGLKNDGTIICQFQQDQSSPFVSVTAIPDDWRAFVKPALEYHAQHSAELPNAELDELRKLATGENPFIALTALRHVLSKSKTDEEIDAFVDLARSLPKFRQAVLTFSILKSDNDKSHGLVQKIVNRSQRADELAGVALGIEAWSATHGRNLHGLGVMELRDKVTQKWQSFESDPPPADVGPSKKWLQILAATGLREAKPQANE